MQPFRILIVDDHSHAREAIREILEDYKDFQIIGEAKNGEEAIQLTEQYMPDIILMDIDMPVMDGLEATKRIKLKFPYVKIVMTTVSDDITDLFDALKKGAQGYLLKNIQSETWCEHLRAFALDEVPMSKEIAFQILKEFPQRKARTEENVPLSTRELEVLQLVAKGLSNREISETLIISEHTVKSHLKNILSKLHLDNRVQLTLCFSAGIGLEALTFQWEWTWLVGPVYGGRLFSVWEEKGFRPVIKSASTFPWQHKKV